MEFPPVINSCPVKLRGSLIVSSNRFKWVNPAHMKCGAGVQSSQKTYGFLLSCLLQGGAGTTFLEGTFD